MESIETQLVEVRMVCAESTEEEGLFMGLYLNEVLKINNRGFGDQSHSSIREAGMLGCHHAKLTYLGHGRAEQRGGEPAY